MESPRSFVHFILEPFYKIISLTLTKDKAELIRIMKSDLGGIQKHFKKEHFEMNIHPLLKLVMRHTFGNSTQTMVDTMVSSFRTAKDATAGYVDKYFQHTDASAELCAEVARCDPRGPLCIHIVKQYYNEGANDFGCYGRILSGTISQGQSIKILGRRYTPEEQEDMVVQKARSLSLMQDGGRHRLEIDQLSAGNWVLIDGIDQSIAKTATIFDVKAAQDSLSIFRPLDFGTEPVIKVACEPLNPSDLPKMISGLRKLNKSYALSETKVEESGEHILLGTGELYMDSMLQDLRKVFSQDIEIKVSEPFVSIAETVADTSSVKCFCETPNKKNTIQMIAQPLDKGLSNQIEFMAGNFKGMEGILVDKFGWEELTADSVWAFGPSDIGSNMLVDYSLDFETNKQRLTAVKNSIVQGF